MAASDDMPELPADLPEDDLHIDADEAILASGNSAMRSRKHIEPVRQAPAPPSAATTSPSASAQPIDTANSFGAESPKRASKDFSDVANRNKPGLGWLRRVYSSFDRKYKKNLKALMVVHPTMFVKTMLTLFRPFISSKFGKKISFIARLADLQEHINLTQLNLPPDVKSYDAGLAPKRTRSRSQPLPAAEPPQSVFGAATLDDVTRVNDDGIPEVLINCVNYLEFNALQVEGIFRRSANALEVKETKRLFNQGQEVDFDTYNDVFLPAVLIKSFFRDLKEPIFPSTKYHDVLAIALSDEDHLRIERTKAFLAALPDRHRNVLKFLFTFLHEVAGHQAENLMTSSNLAIVMGPNLIWSNNTAASLTDMGVINGYTAFLIDNYDAIFL
eukprot:TRINITY_DN12660_c0_g1_i1.p1 TRINITY_DN12660_c0_g1~~TRINITY_DN12660_c0_g1_i1.p1  ORF type:complete len:387 (+),score=93.07 TRINITY_DN12660_c0_g1_i1:3-1163(+)